MEIKVCPSGTCLAFLTPPAGVRTRQKPFHKEQPRPGDTEHFVLGSQHASEREVVTEALPCTSLTTDHVMLLLAAG